MRRNKGSMAKQLLGQAEHQTDGFAYLGWIMLPLLPFRFFTVYRIPDIDHKAPLIPRICTQGLLPRFIHKLPDNCTHRIGTCRLRHREYRQQFTQIYRCAGKG
ncbi:hypothetical protein D3C75_1236600 [compost metagenome]